MAYLPSSTLAAWVLSATRSLWHPRWRTLAILLTGGLLAAAGAGRLRAANPPADPVEALLSRMTLEEKIGQMCQFAAPEYLRQSAVPAGKQASSADMATLYPNLRTSDIEQMVREGKIGSFLNVLSPAEAERLQSLAQESRLKIPLLIGIDAIHGDGLIGGATVYPTPLTLASTFDDQLVKTVARQTAHEVRANGAQWVFSPGVDVARDARWGRTGETFGEDPYLCGRMGVAMVQGYQGDGAFGQASVLACVKHLIGGGMPNNGLNAAPTDVSERTLRTVLLPPFFDAFRAGAGSLMVAHNALNGVPCHANRWLVETLARREGGFEGLVVSDWLDIERLVGMHHVAANQKEAVFQAVMSGIDMHMHGPNFLEPLLELVKEGRVPEARIDQSARRILRAKQRLGLLAGSFSAASQGLTSAFKAEQQAVALEAARKGIVLLKNQNHLLPLEPSRCKRIVVTGPLADSPAILGDWTVAQPESNVVSILQGLRRVAPTNCELVYVDVGRKVRSIPQGAIAQAAAQARLADVTVVVVGENSLRYDTQDHSSGENVDRSDIDLPGQQAGLIQALVATGKPTVVVLVNSRPLGCESTVEQVPALLEAWEPGCQGGLAVAEILFGKVNPSGRLPVSIPRSAGHIQTYYNYLPSQYSRRFAFGKSDALFWFGQGLSYTSFEYSRLQVPEAVGISDQVKVQVDVTNTGKRPGEEVVLAYATELVSSVATPVKALKAYRRVALQPGETRRVELSFPCQQLALWDQNGNWTVEPGEFELTVGNQKARFRVGPPAGHSSAQATQDQQSTRRQPRLASTPTGR